ncbi:MAG: acyl-CoA synthetase [Rhodospirillales bacterium]|nr:acyl-CoA synthetase [Rhodospirillales bacterium]MDE2576905.1 acyl-CoA synthetase [Rhodospirillales bacterium]
MRPLPDLATLNPGAHAARQPDKPALIDAGTGAVVTYRILDDGSNRFANLLHRLGLRRGDHIAIFMENHPLYLEICWAALRSGLYITAVNRYLTAGEAAYIVRDCGARVLVSSQALAEVAGALAPLAPDCVTRLMVDGVIAGWDSYEAQTAKFPATPLAEEWLGDTMLYSSGTTGRPKGIKRKLPDVRLQEGFRSMETFTAYDFHADMTYLSPAPIYHAAPLAYCIATQRFGGTVVMMRRFDPLEALRLIGRYRITHSQWVPTMFVRMLKLSAAERAELESSSHVCAIHAAAPCPVEVKRAMIAWWGPIIQEYYAATESNGATRITSAEWLAHPGSVGQAKMGILHICDDDGRDLPPGESGLVYFERDEMPFEYHNDPDRTRRAQHPDRPGWTTLGDVGHIDAEGYLYLTDRKAFMIISGGVNIYPQAIEDALVTHPKVRDVAVIGVPDADLGEAVKAIIEPAEGVAPNDALAAELTEFLRARVARYMVPKSIDFIDEMPRLPTGKLYKQALRARYHAGQTEKQHV